jgi:hypothetical protein
MAFMLVFVSAAGMFLQERHKKAILGATLRFARNQRPAASLEH